MLNFLSENYDWDEVPHGIAFGKVDQNKQIHNIFIYSSVKPVCKTTQETSKMWLSSYTRGGIYTNSSECLI